MTKFRSNMLYSVGSSGIGFALTLISTPIMTRLFPASAYGTNGIVISAATLISGLGLMGLPVALARTQQTEEQKRLVNASLQASLFLAVLCAILVSITSFSPNWPSDLSISVVLFFPFLVLSHCLQRIIASTVTARGLFVPMSAAQVANAAVARGMSLLGGWLIAPVALVMISADALGKLAALALSLKLGKMWPISRLEFRFPDFQALIRAIADYRDYALQSNFATMLPLITTFFVQNIIALRLGMESNGYYLLAVSILTLPVSLISLASAPVVFHRLLTTFNTNPRHLPVQVLMAMAGYLACGAALMLPIFLFGPQLFAFAFGAPWRLSGEVAVILSLPQVLAFSLTGVAGLFQVVRANSIWLGAELLGAIVIIGGVWQLPVNASLLEAVKLLALLNVGYQIIMHLTCLWAARRVVVHG